MNLRACAAASLIAALACSGAELVGPGTGSLEVSAATTGAEPDLDGYSVVIDSGAGQPLAVNGTVVFSQLDAGNHAVRLGGIAPNCTVGGQNPLTVSVTADTTAHVAFQIVCVALSGSVQVTAATNGQDLDPDGYTVAVDGGLGEALPTNGSVTIADLFAGEHTVTFGGVALNCTVTGANPRPVSVTPGATVELAFQVTCAGFGAIQVSATTSGVDLDADGYTVTLDGGAAQAVAINGSVTFSQLLAGDHTVVLSGIAPNCRLSGQNPATVTVTSGATAQLGVQIACAQVPTTLTFAMLRAGQDYTCGIVVGGAAYCWGWGQPGIVPTYASGGLAFASIDAGPGLFTCGIISDGSAYCWGLNSSGQLGNGSTTDSPSPTAVAGGLLFDSVQAGALHTCALAKNGAAYCWGFNLYGELGAATAQQCEVAYIGSAPCSTTPVAVNGGLQFVSVSTGDHHSCGLTASGAAYCWGANDFGQLGVGTTTGPEQCGSPCSTVPVPVAGGLTFASLTAGELHTCGLTAAGAAYCWGRNDEGQLGDGTTGRDSVPVAVAGGLTFTALSGGGVHTCGLVAGGAAFCWGAGNFGQLGNVDNGFGNSAIPLAVAGGHAFASLTAGANHTCGLDLGSVAYCWGRNDTGGLGDGTGISTNVPVRVAGQP